MTVPRFVGGGRIEFGEKPVPTPGPGELLVQIRANALCGSERGQFFGGSNVTPGHEAAGIVAAAGPDTQTPPGTPGVIFLMDFCGVCRSCRLGFTHQCLAKRADVGFTTDGGYGQFAVVHETHFFPIDADLSFPDATLLLDIMGTGGHALARACLVHPDIHSVYVAGAGPIGLAVLAMTKIVLGDIPVFVSDVTEYRLTLAEQLGGLPVNVSRETAEAGMKQHGQERVDAAFDTSGKTAARQDALNALDKRGVLVCIGHGEGLTLTVSPDLIAPERAILGSEYFPFADLPGNLERLKKHRDYLRQIITHTFPVADIQQAFELFWSGQTGKVIVEQ